jgi:cytochrome c peroxidase
MHRLPWIALLAATLGTATTGCDPDADGDLGAPVTLPPEVDDSPPPEPPPPLGMGDLDALMAQLVAEKPAVMARQRALLEARYDLADRSQAGLTMTGGKPLQIGIRARLPDGLDWERLGSMSAEEIHDHDLFPPAFMPLPHPRQRDGGMLFPNFHIEEVLAQTGRDLQRFDLDFDVPDHFLPEFPAPIFLTTRPDLGDVSRGQLITTDNYFTIFKDVLNPKQLDGLRLLVTPFAQQQFNLTDDRRSAEPSLGVACFDCHANGHSNAGTHLVGDIRPQELRNRIDTPSLRGTNIQQLFGSQRALMSVEDFTEFEQRAAYFDGDPASAAAKGVNPLDRATQVHAMAELQKILDFPPAPRLDLYGRLDPDRATRAELRGEALFFGRARCGSCHPAPYYTDNSMHDLALERFFATREINGLVADGDGPIKTFSLRGIKDSPPYLHDGRLLTLEDTVEFFNLVLELDLGTRDKEDLVAFLRAI